MFLYLLNNSPIWTDLDKKSRYLRLFITATVIYIVINSFLNSKYVDNIEFLINNKKYLYYLIFFDIAATLLKIYFGKNSDKIEKKIKNKSLSEKDIQQMEQMRQIYEMQQMQQMQQMQHMQEQERLKRMQQMQQMQQMEEIEKIQEINLSKSLKGKGEKIDEKIVDREERDRETKSK